jgi:hypothetical protein
VTTPNRPGAEAATRYRAGQRWSYKTRDGEEASRVTILLTEEVRDYGVLVFVALDGLRVADARAPDGQRSRVSFAAFTLAAIDDGVLAFDGQVGAPDCRELYANWRTAFGAGRAAPFTRTVADAVGTLQAICDARNR